MGKHDSQTTGDSQQQPPPLASSVATRNSATDGAKSGRGNSSGVSRSGPTELPPEFGRYRVKQKLGGGGMGTVYLVENTELEREEALKVPHFVGGDDSHVRERFLREAKSAAKLEHANICPVYDAGVQDGIYYLTMRFLKGKLLVEYTGAPQPARKAVEIVTKLTQALEAAHAKGVIHRDLKPGNVMMVAGVGPVVMDFGLAKFVRQPDSSLTPAGAMLGTPAYMPPEQVQGDLDQMGPASDVYSVGVILYQLLTGRLPFESKTVAIFGQILYTEPPLPSALVPGLNPALDVICQKAMAKAPSHRYPSMKTFESALKDFLRLTPASSTAGASDPANNGTGKPGIFETPTLAPGLPTTDRAAIFQSATLPSAPQKPRSTSFASSRSAEGKILTPSDPDSLPPGLANHPDYDNIRDLGRGGMGVVYLGHNRLMDRDEVLKVLSPQLMDRHGIEERFLREIRAVAKLRHQNIVAAYSAFRLGESIVFAMEYVKGQDLSKLVKLKGPLPVGHTCHFMRQAAQGLQHAFEEGMVHRDIKPGNLMLSRRGDSAVIKILDFGLAKAAREQVADNGLTHAGQMLGTPDYVAPEQIRNAQDADVRADIYSLGCTLYYLLTGGPPFQAANLYDLLQAHHSMYAKPLNLLRSDVPSELAALVAKMMAKEPEQRFRTPSAVAEALKPFDTKGAAAFKRSRPEPSRGGRSDFDGDETYSLAEMPHPPNANQAETVFATPRKPRSQTANDGNSTERPPTPPPAPSGSDGGSPPWKSWVIVAAGLTPILIFLGIIINIVIDKNKATITIERTPDTDARRPDAPRPDTPRPDAPRLDPKAGTRLFNGENLAGWTKVENGSKWAVENGLLVGRGGGPGKPAVLVTDRRDFTNYRLHARLRYPQVGHGWLELRRSGETTKTDCYFVYVGIDSGRPPMGSLGKGSGFIYGRTYPIQAVAAVSPRVTGRWYDVDVEVVNNRMTCSVDGTRVAEFKDFESTFPSGAIAVAGSGVSVIEFERISIEESRPGARPAVPVPTPDPAPIQPETVGARPEALDCTSPSGITPEVIQRTQAKWAKFLGRNVEESVTIGDGVTMTFELAPPGKFWMGSPPNEHGKNGRYPNELLHEVTLTEPFDVGKYEVTQAQYSALTGGRVSFYNGPDRPVEQVTWNDADNFGKLLTRKLSDGHIYRLLTEAEWEYSCRAGRSVSLPFGVGDGRTLTPQDANFDNRVGQTSNVGSYAPNALGLYDMHGNVWEWCADWNEPYPNGPATNPFRATGGPFRVARGGCHNEPAPECRAALRQGSPEPRRDCWMGFRLARSLPPAK